MTVSNREWSTFERKLQDYVGRRVEAASVDDVVGDILLRLVRHESDLSLADNPVAWIYRVAANIITDHYRHRAVEQRIIDRRESSETTDTVQKGTVSTSPEEELARCLSPLIGKLPDRYRDAVRLIDIERVPQKEAARLLGLSISGAKSRVQRGRQKLKQLLLDCCSVQLNRRGGIVDYVSNSCGC